MDEPGTILTLEMDSVYAESISGHIRTTFGVEPVQLEKPGDPRAWLELYYEDEVKAMLAAEVLRQVESVDAVALRTCYPADWQYFWRRHFQPCSFGDRLEVCPAWRSDDPVPGHRTRILLDPGLSFGTGHHFTTRFCLEMIDAVSGKEHPRSCLDLGTGTGLLAIAAVRLFSPGEVLAVDNEEDVVKRAHENAALNGVEHRIEFQVQDITKWRTAQKYDLVLANVYGTLLAEQAPRIRNWVGNTLVMSGIRELEVDMVAEAYREQGGQETVRDGDGEWAGLMFEF